MSETNNSIRSSFAFLRWLTATAAVVVLGGLGHVYVPAEAQSCGGSVNPIVCENSKAGNPSSDWQITGAGDPTIQGFATTFSVKPGDVQTFKIDTTASAYTIEIYRMGYYNGMGARRVGTTTPSASLPQTQPDCLFVSATGLIDCGNWAVSASWTVPSDAVSGIYFARLERLNNGGASHIFFVVRDDTGQSDILFQTSDTTWQAYNDYGGNSLYTGGPGVNHARAYKVSYNRPFATRDNHPEDFVFNAEYPMVRWLERNGYDVSYFSGIDSDARGAEILEHRVFMSVGHDEYWSGTQRTNVEAARGAGVNMVFLSGNEVFWKTRWEPSVDGSNTPRRTLVSYKETHANAMIDPQDPPTWTGTWRDKRFSPPADGGRPEHSLTGQLFRVNDGNTTSIVVPEAQGKMRLWRHTTIATLAPGASATLPNGTLGYEWDEAPQDDATPPGLIRLSTTTRTVNSMLLDNGSTYGAGTATHNLTLYRHPSGAQVFGAGTVQWSWGLDNNHDRGSTAADSRMKQATANLLADMGVQADTLEGGLTPPTPSSDLLAPTAVITSPSPGASIPAGTPINIAGTASEAGGGILAGVEVSTDNGATWLRATGTTSWSVAWNASGAGSKTLLARGFDDSGNMQTPAASVTVNITAGQACPCTIWAPAAVPPAPVDDGDPLAVEVGTRFRSDVAGYITGIRFYKAAANTGTHTGRLWTNTGTLLGTVTFSGETASGWQQANLPNAVPITANTTYLVSYHAPNGHYTGTDNFFNAALDRPPLHGLRDGTDGNNGVYRYGAGGVFPTDTFAAEGYWVDVVFNTVAPPDTTAPGVTAVFPPNASTGNDPNGNVTATFNEAMDPATISSSSIAGEGGPSQGTFELHGPVGNLINATVTYDSVTRIATLDPDQPLGLSTTYSVLMKGGTTDPRAKDLAGNALPANVTWTFTTAAAPPPPSQCPCSIWTPATVPSKIDDGDTNSVEVGTRFRSSVAGYITGARFYKAAANTGTHVARLWTNAGAQLGSATFSNETASGWQETSFATPIPISANTTYVITYHANNGHYSSQPQLFGPSAITNGPLTGLRNGTDGANGIYQYSSGAIFPTQTFNAEGYFVDVVFNTTIGPDTTPPLVTSATPVVGVSGIPTTTNVRATFSETMTSSTINGTTVQLRDGANNLVPATVTYDAGTRTVTLDPTATLQYLTLYTATVKGGSTDPRVKDAAGNALAADHIWSFTTAAPPPPPPTQGPGGPVLVITSSTNPFTTYLAEILRTEGLNAFATADLTSVTAGTLTSYDVVILGDMPLTQGQADMFSAWVTGGGNLIAMRPDKKLASLMGLTDVGTTLAEAYLLVNTASSPGAGIVNQTIQFHGTADRYTLNGATAVATLYSNVSTATTHPAVTTRVVGNGNAVAFTYDLARSVVLTRQGNPAWSNQERDGLVPIRSDDLFFGARAGDVQPDWVNLNKVAIPQADEQQRLLWNIILKINATKRPLPRFWYFPRMLKAVVVMTGDDHANGGTAGRFDQYLSLSTPGCSVADWGCIRGTSYVFPGTPIDPGAVANYIAQGFEIALHVNTQCLDYTPTSIANFFSTQLGQFATGYPAVPPPTTNRTHCIAWSDYTSQAQVSFNNGIRLDTNYYYWPGSWVADRPGMFTGSGMPMRFATSTGTMIDVYQAASQMTDESSMTYAFHANSLLDKALGAEGYYLALTANMHTDANPSQGQTGSDAIIAAAQARSVPVITARQMLEWLDGRNGSSFQSITWNGNNLLQFNIAVGAGANGLHTMVPATANGSPVVSIAFGGQAVAFTLATIKGQQYAVFPAQSGLYQVSYGVDGVPPVITAVGATPGAGDAIVQWTTNEASNSRVDYGTSPAALSLSVSNSSQVTAHSIVLPNLLAGTPYFYRVTSADAAGNAATSPVTAQAPASFTTSQPAISIADTSVTEGNSGTTTASFTLTLSAPSSQTVTVSYATAAGTASGGADFTAVSGIATFTPGATTTSVPVSVIGETAFEVSETFAVNLSAAVNATIADSQGSGTILNDDPLPSFTITDATVTEGNAGTVTATLTVTASSTSPATMTVNYVTENGTASSGTDYVAATGTLTFAPGVTTQPIAITVNGDVLNEAVETALANLSGAVNASIADAQGTVSISNDDPVPSLAIGDVSLTEGNSGTKLATFTVTLSAVSGQTVNVNYATANGSASAGSDYVAASGTATINAGNTTATVNVTINGDATLEIDETFVVNLSAPVNATLADNQATGTIVNDEGVPSASINDVSVAEGNSGTAIVTATVTLASAGAQTITINYATANGTATAGSDYVTGSGSVIFPAGVLTQPVNVTINGDALDEPNETFVINLSAPVNAVLSDAQGQVTITDDDPTPAISIADVTLTEGNAGTVNAVFNVTLSGASAATVTAAYATANGTATAGTDYVAGSGTVSFAPGTTAQTVSIAVNGDVLDEIDEGFVVNLSSPANATIADAQGAATIADNDAEPTIAIADVTLSEGNSGTKVAAFTLTLSAASGKTVTAGYATANVSATAGSDYVAATGTANFAAGTTTATVNVTINGDVLFELDETFQVNLSAPVNATIADAQAIGSITNDDALPSFSIADVTVFEGNSGTSNAIVTVTASTASGQTMTVGFATANGTATAGSDYTAATGTLTFAPGILAQTITVVITGDTTSEATESLDVNLSSPVNATVLDGIGVVTITNDDGAPTAGLVAAYGFNENTGTTTADSSGNNLTGTIAGAAWTTAGKNGNALSFDGVNDMVSIADNSVLDVATVTLMAWVRPTTLGDWRTAVLKESSGGLAYALYAEDNLSRPAAYINLGQDRDATGTTAMVANTWTHIAMTYDGTAIRLYTNGTLVATTTASGTLATSTQPLRIGGNAIWSEFFAGQIDDVRVYNRALTLTEIQSGMNTPVSP